jgi:hypothetical protein
MPKVKINKKDDGTLDVTTLNDTKSIGIQDINRIESMDITQGPNQSKTVTIVLDSGTVATIMYSRSGFQLNMKNNNGKDSHSIIDEEDRIYIVE